MGDYIFDMLKVVFYSFLLFLFIAILSPIANWIIALVIGVPLIAFLILYYIKNKQLEQLENKMKAEWVEKEKLAEQEKQRRPSLEEIHDALWEEQEIKIQKDVETNPFDRTTITVYKWDWLRFPKIVIRQERNEPELVTMEFLQYVDEHIASAENHLKKFEVLKNNGDVYDFPQEHLAFSTFDIDTTDSTGTAVLKVNKELLAALQDSEGYRLNCIGSGYQYPSQAINKLIERFLEDYPQVR